jgi:hypothetical protein
MMDAPASRKRRSPCGYMSVSSCFEPSSLILLLSSLGGRVPEGETVTSGSMAAVVFSDAMFTGDGLDAILEEGG